MAKETTSVQGINDPSEKFSVERDKINSIGVNLDSKGYAAAKARAGALAEIAE